CSKGICLSRCGAPQGAASGNGRLLLVGCAKRRSTPLDFAKIERTELKGTPGALVKPGGGALALPLAPRSGEKERSRGRRKAGTGARLLLRPARRSWTVRAAHAGDDSQRRSKRAVMGRLNAIFIAFCMVLIAASAGIVAWLAASFTGMEATVLAIAVMTALVL